MRIDQAVRSKILRDTIKEIQIQNADVSEEEAMNLANEAAAWARENRSGYKHYGFRSDLQWSVRAFWLRKVSEEYV